MKEKKQIPLYSFYDLSGMNRHLNAMARKGWFLKKAGTFLWTYEQGEKKDLAYGVCPIGEVEAYTPEEGKKFRDRAAEKGWTLSVTSPKLQVYTSEEKEPGNLNADPFDRLEGIRQAARPSLFFSWVMIVLAVLSGLLLHFRMKIMPVSTMADAFGLVSPLALGLLGLYFLSDMVRYYVLKNKAEIAAAEGKFLFSSRSFHSLLLYVLLVDGVLLALAGVTSGGSPLLRTFLIYLVAILMALLVISSLRKYLLSRKAEGKRTSAASVLLNIALGVILVGGVAMAVNHMNAADAGYNGTLPVTAQELGLARETDSVRDYLRSKASFLLRHSEATQMIVGEDQTQEVILSYEMVEGRAGRVDGKVLDHFLDRMSMTSAGETNVHYEPIDEEMWQAKQAWQMYDGEKFYNVYLVLYDNCLMELGAPEPLTEAQMSLVGEKLN